MIFTNSLCFRKYQKIGLALLVFFLARNAFTDIIGMPDEGWSFDLPEGFELTDWAGTDRFRFTHSLLKTDLLIAQYERSQFSSAESALSHVQKQLTSSINRAPFTWRNREAAIGQIEPGTSAGWAIALELPKNRGWLSLVAISSPSNYEKAEMLIVSTLDSICTDDGSWFVPGPMTSFAWPSEGTIAANFITPDIDIEVQFDSIDQAAAQSVVDREFSLLTTYLNTPLVFDAWKRYYRMIWKDSWQRLERSAFMLSVNLPQSSEKITEALLSWAQDFHYERTPEGSDFISLPSAFMETRGDCDSRSLLLVVLLNQMGVDAILMVSQEFGHALVAVDCPGEGARFESGGKKYLVADTTARVRAGLIDSEMADPAAWFGVHFSAYPPLTE